MLNLIYNIVCEGKSETAYIQELNRHFREQSIDIVLHPKEIGSGHYNAVVKKYKSVHSSNKKQNIAIWVDHDIYSRNELKNMEKYSKKPHNIPDFLFNYMNFEDFIVLHLDNDTLSNWVKICQSEKHFDTPMKSECCKNHFINNVFSNYQKGILPFKISEKELHRLFQNNNDDTQLKSDFAVFLKQILDNMNK